MRDEIAVTMYDLSRAASGSEETVSDTSLAIDLEDLFRESTMQSFIALVHAIAEKGEANFLDSEVLLAFAKSGYMLSGYILTFRDLDLKKKMYQRTGRVYRKTAAGIC